MLAPSPALPAFGISRTLRADTLVILLSLAALLAWDLSGLDLALSSWFGNAQGFAWRDRWITGTLLHDWARYPAWALFGVLLVNIRWPLPFARGLSRRERVLWVLVTLACVILIPLLKHGSATSCPWDQARFGGDLAVGYVPHWQFWKQDGGPGRCFPSGHASTAFCFLAGWFALRRTAPMAARRWLAIALACGAVFAWVQVMRGAHYLSHSLWTAWLCWTLSAAAWHLAEARRGLRRAAAPAGLSAVKG